MAQFILYLAPVPGPAGTGKTGWTGAVQQLPVWPCSVSTVACGFSHPDLSSCLLASLPLSPACLFVTVTVVSILLATCQPVTVRNSPPRQLDKSAGQASAHQAWDLDCGLASQGQIAALAWTTGLCPLGL